MAGKKTVIVMAILAACLLLIGMASLNIKTWQEEVRLLDGRVITVTQKRRLEGVYTGQDFGNIPREAWVTFNLPEFSPQQIVWHENLIPLVLNIYNGKLFIVAFPKTTRELRQFGHPNPEYVGYRFENGQWTRIGFSDIPVAIYDSNMWADNVPKKGADRVTLDDKAKVLKDPQMPSDYKRIDPSPRKY
jgi:hypothetical protein